MSKHKSAKLRRHSGRVTPRVVSRTKINTLMDSSLDLREYWDDWNDYRDGFRGSKDRTLLRSRFIPCAENLQVEKWNNKINKLTKRRYAMKNLTV